MFTATLRTAGSESLTATDGADGLAGAETGIVVSDGAAGTAVSFVVSGFVTETTAGVAHNFTVTARDALGNVATGFAGTVTLSTSDSQGSFDTTVYTFTTGVGADNGVHTFSGMLDTAAVQSITAVSGTANGSETGIVVSAAAATNLVVSGYPASTVTGSAHTFTVTALDAFGNVATGYTGTVALTSSDPAAVFGNAVNSAAVTTYAFTSGPGADDGVHTFSATFNTPALSQSFTVSAVAQAGVAGSGDDGGAGIAGDVVHADGDGLHGDVQQESGRVAVAPEQCGFGGSGVGVGERGDGNVDGEGIAADQQRDGLDHVRADGWDPGDG